MAGTVVTQGRVQEAQTLRTLYNTLFLGLYSNNVTISPTTVFSNLTEASFPGYSRIALGSWGTAFLNASNQGEIDEVLRTFTLSTTGGPYAIYGYFLVDASSNLIAVEANVNAPVYLADGGDTYSVQPRKVQGDLC